MYLKIVNPLTNRKVNINSKLGLIILKKYINNLQKEGGSNIDEEWEIVDEEEESTNLFNGNIEIKDISSDGIELPLRRVASVDTYKIKEEIDSVPRALTSVNSSDVTEEIESKIRSEYNRLHFYDREGRLKGQLALNKDILWRDSVAEVSINQYGVKIATAYVNRTLTEPGSGHLFLGMFGTVTRLQLQLDAIIKINRIQHSFCRNHIISYALRNPIDDNRRVQGYEEYNPQNIFEERSAPIRDANPVSDHNALVSEFLCVDNRKFIIITFNLQGFSHYDQAGLTEQFYTKLDNFMSTINNYLFEERIIFMFQEIVLREGKQHVELIINALKERINSYLDDRNLGSSRPDYVFIYDGFTSMIMYNKKCFRLDILQIIPRIKYGSRKKKEYDTENSLSDTDVQMYGQIARDSIPTGTMIQRFDETTGFLGDPELGRGKMSNAYQFSIEIFGSWYKFVVVNIHLKAAGLLYARVHPPEIRNILCRIKVLSQNFNNPVFLAGDFNAFCYNKAEYIKDHLAIVMAEDENCNSSSRISKIIREDSELRTRENGIEELVDKWDTNY